MASFTTSHPFTRPLYLVTTVVIWSFMRCLSTSGVTYSPFSSYGNHFASCECQTRQCPMMNMSFASPNSTNLSASSKLYTFSSGWISSLFMQFSATIELKCFFTSSTPVVSTPVISQALRAVPMRNFPSKASLRPCGSCAHPTAISAAAASGKMFFIICY